MKITDSRHRLKEILSETGDTQNEMARKTGLAKSAISNYLNGTRVPRQDAISKIAETYNVNPSWLMGYDTPKNQTVIEIEEIRKKILKKRLELLEYVDNDDKREAILKDLKELENLLNKISYDPSLTIDIEEKQTTQKALDLYTKYLKADPNIQAAIESLLKSSRPNS